jgi:SAM-dependent methyltransferase
MDFFSLKRVLGLSLLKLLTAVVLIAEPSLLQAQVRCAGLFEIAGKTQIENQYIKSNMFKVGRHLWTYDELLPFVRSKRLMSIMKDLPPGSVWVDMGAGAGQALWDGLTLNRNIRGVGIAYKRPDYPWVDLQDDHLHGRVEYLEGDFVENMDRGRKLDHLKGRIDLITDIYGPLSYSKDLPLLLQTNMNLLKKDGLLIFSVMTETGVTMLKDPPEPVSLNAVFKNSQRLPEGLLAWIRTIPGIELVETTPFHNNAGPAYENSVAIKIRKTQDDVRVPRTLKTIDYQSGAPPSRVFEVTEDP